jgi:hypothetical protein
MTRLGMPMAALTCSVSIVCGVETPPAANPVAPAEGWTDYIESMKQAPGIYQLYTFAEGEGLRTRNLLDSAPFSEMVIAGKGFFAGGKEDYPRWVSGRWPEKSALSIGTAQRSIGRTHFYGGEGKDFAVALWVRTPPEAGRMVFASVGDGYSNGWRLNSSGRGLEFILGRKPGTGPCEGVVAVRADDCLRPQVWQQLVAVLNDNKLQLYVDGKLSGETAFDGIYTHVATPAVRHHRPEVDTGGLQLGATASYRDSGRFDIDELAIFSQALDADHIAGLYAAGKPESDPEDQIRQHQAERARQEKLDGIVVALPTDTFGYFPNDQAIPVTVSADAVAAPLFAVAGSVEIEVSRFQGESLTKEALPLTVAGDGAARVDYAIAPDRCGLYVLDIAVRDGAGQALKTLRLDFARRLPLPPRDEIPETSMFNTYVGRNTETPTFGAKTERIIQPVFGRDPDGGARFAGSDAWVDWCVSMGMDVLYCIWIGFWEDGRYKNVEDWKADPRIHTDHVRNLATRYKGKVKYWEIINEPNAHGIKPEDYVELLKQAHAIFKEIDPEAKIVGPCGTSNYHQWTEEVLAAGGGPYFDIMSFHNYVGDSPLKHMELGKVEAVKASMREHIGRELPMWNSECGIDQPARLDGRPATDDELEKLFGGRARRNADGAVVLYVNAISMVNEHLSACWQVQSMLVDRAQGVEKYFMLMRPSQPYPMFSPGDEVVTEKGVALAALQSLLAHTVDARFIPLAVRSTAGIALVDGGGSNHVALFADRNVRLVFDTGLRADTEIKAMDYLGNPLSFQVGADGLLALELTPAPVYLLDMPAAFAVNSDGLKLSSGILQLEPMSEVEIMAELRNPFDRAVTATMVPDVSAGIAAAAVKEVELAPGETRLARIAWRTDGMVRGSHWLRAQLHLDGRLYSVVEKSDFFSHGRMTRIPRLLGDFVLDGDTAKWADVPRETANNREQAVIGRPVEGAPNPAFWDGTKDLSYTFKTAWSEAAIHFLIEVTDNILRPSADAQEDQNPWLFDGVELFLDARPMKERLAALSAGALQAGIALRMGETAAECPVRILGKEPLPVTIRAVSRKTDEGYLVEGKISPVEGGPLKLADGAQVNLDVSVNDNDDTPDRALKLGRRVQMALHGTANNNIDTSRYGRYVLVSEEPQANLISDGALSQAPLVPADFRGHADVPGWRFSGAEKTPWSGVSEIMSWRDAATKEELFWGAKRVDGRNALWIGTQAEEHIEAWWERLIPVKADTPYAAFCQLRGSVQGKAQWASGGAMVYFLNANGGWLGHRRLEAVRLQETPDQWRTVTASFITPADTSTIGVRTGILSKGVNGFADYYWSDFELREISERQIGADAGALDPE